MNCMVGKSLAEQKVTKAKKADFYSVKESVFPFIKFPGVDSLLGPEMKSTGEVMGVGRIHIGGGCRKFCCTGINSFKYGTNIIFVSALSNRLLCNFKQCR